MNVWDLIEQLQGLAREHPKAVVLKWVDGSLWPVEPLWEEGVQDHTQGGCGDVGPAEAITL